MSKSKIYEPVYIQFSSLLNQGVHNACMHSIVGYHNKKKLWVISPQKTESGITLELHVQLTPFLDHYLKVDGGFPTRYCALPKSLREKISIILINYHCITNSMLYVQPCTSNNIFTYQRVVYETHASLFLHLPASYHVVRSYNIL